jgi:phage gp29-like protein
MSVIDEKRRTMAIQNRFNPIRGLVPQKLSFILDNFRLGYMREAALLWDAMIRRDLLIRNVVSKRCKAVARAQWEILTVDDSAEALQQKKVLERLYNNITVTNALDANERGGMGLLLRLMMSAQGMRFAAFELVWKTIQGPGRQLGMQKRSRPVKKDLTESGDSSTEDTAGTESELTLTADLNFVPLEFFENRTGKLRFLKEDFAVEGEEMLPGEWLVAVGDGIMEATSVAYCYKHLALKDWVACNEAFGTPIPHIKTESARDSKEWDEIETAASQLMAQRYLVTSNNESLSLIEMSAGGTNLPFPPMVELMDRAIASLWRGADLSTISQGQAGIGASLQAEESDLLLEDDAKWLAEILWDQIDAPALKNALGVTEPLAYVSILPPKRKNVAQDLAIDTALVNWGMPLSQDDSAERYGRSLAEPGDPLLMPTPVATDSTGGNGANGGLENSESRYFKSKLLEAKRALMAPILSRLRRIDELEGDEKRNALLALLAELPGLKVQLENAAGAGELADSLAEAMKEALIEGFSQKHAKTAKEGKKTR